MQLKKFYFTYFKMFVFYFFLIDFLERGKGWREKERERKREEHLFVVLIYAFTGCFLYVPCL